MGRLEKEGFLRETADDKEVLEILKFLFNPYIVTGISDKKIAKAKKTAALPLLAGAGADAAQRVNGSAEFSLAVLEYFKKNSTGRDKDVEYLVTFPEIVHAIVKRDLKLGIQNTTLNKVFGDGFVPKFDVQLAESYADNADYVTGKDFIITEKLDGIRCVLMFNGDTPMFFSRSGQPILDLVELTDCVRVLDRSFVYDGELLLDNPKNLPSEDLYRQTVKVTNADAPKRGLYFNIFDMVDAVAFKGGIDKTPARERKARLMDAISKITDKDTKLKTVPIEYIGNDQNEIPKWLKHFCDREREGIMLNIADAPYECKRGKNILKVKQFYTADVLVIDVEEGTGANRGKLGAVIIQFNAPDGKSYNCRVGSGFKIDEREKFWADKSIVLNNIIEIGYFELSRNQRDDGFSMRFPTFKRLRPDKTEISMY